MKILIEMITENIPAGKVSPIIPTGNFFTCRARVVQPLGFFIRKRLTRKPLRHKLNLLNKSLVYNTSFLKKTSGLG